MKMISAALIVGAISMLSVSFLAVGTPMQDAYFAILDVMMVVGGIGAIVEMFKKSQ